MSAAPASVLARYRDRVKKPTLQLQGHVTQVLGMLIEARVPNAAVGDLYRIAGPRGDVLAEVVALKQREVVLMPFGNLSGLRVGAALTRDEEAWAVPVGDGLRGRVIDAFGRPLDDKPLPVCSDRLPLFGTPLPTTERAPVEERMPLGVRALDAFIPCGRGQRLGIFAGPGVGKSVLLGMIAEAATADVVVMALVGERGREVGHFVDKVLGDGMKNAVVVVATSDRPAPERVRAAFTATTIAEHFRSQGRSVLLFVDSLTRLCMAQREIGLAVGEPPATKGYPPSSFALLPTLLERAAPAKAGGSITGLYTVLVEGDDFREPVSDAARGLLDGHVMLSRRLAERGHFPAIDVLQSISRLEGDLTDARERRMTQKVRGWMARLEDAKDLLAIGAYRPGSDQELDVALAKRPQIEAFLKQQVHEPMTADATQRGLIALAGAEVDADAKLGANP